MMFEVGKIYHIKYSWTEFYAKCQHIDEHKIPMVYQVRLSVSEYFDNLGLYLFADQGDEGWEESTKEDLDRFAKEKEKEFKKNMGYIKREPEQAAFQLTLF